MLCGLGLLHVSLFTDLCLRYVKEGMRPPLIASGAVLILLGLASAVLDRGGEEHREPDGSDGSGGAGGHVLDHADGFDGSGGAGGHVQDHADGSDGSDGPGGHAQDHADGYGRSGVRGHSGAHENSGAHDHSGLPRVAWLLLLPALSLLLYAPPALGAYTAARQPPKPVAHPGGFDPLPRTSPLPMTLSDFTSRVQQDRGQAVKGRVVRMTGFVTPGSGGRSGGWELTRIILNCCAADAQSVKVRVYGGPTLPADTWVSVTGTWHPDGTLGTGSAAVALDARTVTKVPRPVNGYQDALPLS